MCGWKVAVDDVSQRPGTPSQTEPASTPEVIENQQSSGGPSEKYQCIGAGFSYSRPSEATNAACSGVSMAFEQ
jgi:hypothetical protein